MTEYATRVTYAGKTIRWKASHFICITDEVSGREFDIDVAGLFQEGFYDRERALIAKPVIPPLPDLPQYTVVVVPDIQYPNQGRVYTKIAHAWFRYDKSTASFDTDDGLFRNNPSARVVMPGGRLTRESALQALGLRQETM